MLKRTIIKKPDIGKVIKIRKCIIIDVQPMTDDEIAMCLRTVT